MASDRRSAYRRGRQFEYRARDTLKKMGYWVMRAAGSKGCVDVIALAPGKVLMVQAKLTGKIGTEEWNNLMDEAQKAGGRPVLVSRIAERRRGLCWEELVARKTPRKRGSGEKRLFDPRL